MRRFAKLSSQQRANLFQERRKAATERLKEFFRLSKKEQQARLDQDIKRMEERRKESDSGKVSSLEEVRQRLEGT